MELEKDREEMKRKSTVTIPEKQEFKVDPWEVEFIEDNSHKNTLLNYSIIHS